MKSAVQYLGHHRRLVLTLLAAVVAVFALINVFSGLGSERIRNWDEARHGISACEMMESGNYLVNTFDYQADYWNVKPVLAFYPALLGMMTFGKNVFGLRFFSAVAYLCIAALIFFLLRREAGTAAALIGTAAFVVSPTNWVHSFRQGDPDAVFMLFCFAAFVCLWRSLDPGRGFSLSLAALFLGLAFLVKSFHVGVFGILALIFVIVHWKRYTLKDLLPAVAAGLAPVLIWGAFRFHADGWAFFQNMIERDLLGRLEEGHSSEQPVSPWYYYLTMLNHFLIVIPLAVIALSAAAGRFFRGKSWFSDPAPAAALGKWAGFGFLLPLVMFSCCSVKLPWYIFPALLFVPVVFGVAFHFAWRRLLEELARDRRKVYLLPPLAVILTSLVWIGIGEGKAIRNRVKMIPQRDVLTAAGGQEEYRGKEFFCIGPEGRAQLPPQKFLLVIRFVGGKMVLANVEQYRKRGENAFLVCSFGPVRNEAELRRRAEQTASELSLRLIRCAGEYALYRCDPR